MRSALGRIAGWTLLVGSLAGGVAGCTGGGPDTLVYKRTSALDEVYVALNRSDAPASVSGLPNGTLTDLLTGEALSGPSVPLGPRSVRVLVP